MKTTNWLYGLLLLLTSLVQAAQLGLDSPISVNSKNAPLRSVLETIASQSGLTLVMDPTIVSTVSVTQSETTGRSLLSKLALENSIEYSVRGSTLVIDKVAKPTAGAPSLGDVREIVLHHALASELVTKLASIVSADGKLLADEHSNKLIFMGPQKTFEKLKSLVYYFDSAQKQIMIEAIIAETTHSFTQNLGISLGNGNSNNAIRGQVSTPGPDSANGTFSAILGKVNSNALSMKLQVAESNGDAKIVSRPKVVTLNNRVAKVESGITYHVKTLSNVSSGNAPSSTTQSNQGVVTGSLASLDATLSLSILPLLIGNDQIKLTIDINDASPDTGSGIDSIPGILKNSATTEVIIKDKQTAIIAGLVKQTKSKGSSGVPILSDIPLIGGLFKSSSKLDNNSELVIFLTPTIDNSGNITVVDATKDPALFVHSPLDPTETKPEPEERKPASDDSDSNP